MQCNSHCTFETAEASYDSYHSTTYGSLGLLRQALCSVSHIIFLAVSVHHLCINSTKGKKQNEV